MWFGFESWFWIWLRVDFVLELNLKLLMARASWRATGPCFCPRHWARHVLELVTTRKICHTREKSIIGTPYNAGCGSKRSLMRLVFAVCFFWDRLCGCSVLVFDWFSFHRSI